MLNQLKKFTKEIFAVWGVVDVSTFLVYMAQIVKHLPTILKNRNLIPADKAMAGRRIRFNQFGVTIWLEGHSFGGAREIIARNVYCCFPEFLIEPSDIVVDLGANEGIFSTIAALLSQRVIAVEAQSGFVPIIISNAKLNGCAEKVHVDFGMVGAASGFLSDHQAFRLSSHAEADPPKLSMDEIIERHQLPVVNFLKVDIEGSEFSLFSGNLDWLRIVQKIAMEIHLCFGNPNDLVTLLKENGFRVRLVNNDLAVQPHIQDTTGYLFADRKG